MQYFPGKNNAVGARLMAQMTPTALLCCHGAVYVRNRDVGRPNRQTVTFSTLTGFPDRSRAVLTRARAR